MKIWEPRRGEPILEVEGIKNAEGVTRIFFGQARSEKK